MMRMFLIDGLTAVSHGHLSTSYVSELIIRSSSQENDEK